MNEVTNIIVPNNFSNLELDLDWFTYTLLKYIPLDINSMIFSDSKSILKYNKTLKDTFAV